jgi:trk system potassium uptake protein
VTRERQRVELAWLGEVFVTSDQELIASMPKTEWTRRVHVVIVGCGRVGSGLANQLCESGSSVTIVDRNPKAFRRLDGRFSGVKIVGYGFDRDVLVEAGAERADAFAAVTSGDNSNILAARIAKETFGVSNVVARIYDPRRAAIYQRLGISTVASVAWTTDQILRHLTNGVTNVWNDQSGSLSFEERPITRAWIGQKLSGLSDGVNVQVVAVSRAGTASILRPELIGQEGDVLHVLVRTENATGFAALLNSGPAH